MSVWDFLDNNISKLGGGVLLSITFAFILFGLCTYIIYKTFGTTIKNYFESTIDKKINPLYTEHKKLLNHVENIDNYIKNHEIEHKEINLRIKDMEVITAEIKAYYDSQRNKIIDLKNDVEILRLEIKGDLKEIKEKL